MREIGIVGIGVAVDARIVLGIVAAREHARRRIVGIDALVRALERRRLRTRRRRAAGRDQRVALLRRDVRHEVLPRDVRDVVRVLAARLELAALDRTSRARA